MEALGRDVERQFELHLELEVDRTGLTDAHVVAAERVLGRAAPILHVAPRR